MSEKGLAHAQESLQESGKVVEAHGAEIEPSSSSILFYSRKSSGDALFNFLSRAPLFYS